MYAWSIVDAIDRIRALHNTAVFVLRPLPDGPSPRTVMFSDVNRLRVVNDHPSGKLQQVVAKGDPAIGSLRWVRVEKEPELRLFSCALAPGSAHVSSRVALHAIPPEGQAPGVDRIVLRAGGHEADLSAALRQVDAIVTELEEHLETQLVGKERSPALVDLFIVAAHSR